MLGDQIREKIYSWTVDEGALVMYTGRIVESKSGHSVVAGGNEDGQIINFTRSVQGEIDLTDNEYVE